MRSRRSFWRAVDRLADMIELLIDCHPQGFDVLLGEVPPPSPEEIHAMMNARRTHEDAGVRTASPSHTVEAERIVWDAEKFETVVREARGWGHITHVCREHREHDPRLWAVVMDHQRFVGTSSTRHASRLGYMASRYGLAPNTITRYRREFPEELANAILIPPADSDDWALMPG